MRKIVIIGNGIAGITCARNIRKLCNDHITIISSETEHFYSRTALMYVYMGHMKYDHIKPYEDFFWKKNRLNLVFDHVINVNFNNKSLHYKSGGNIQYDQLIIATGSKTKKFDWPGQDIQAVVGLYSYQDLQEIELHTRNIQSTVIVGGGLIGVELAEMMHSRKIDVTILVRDNNYWGSILPPQDAKLVGAHIEKHGVKVLYQTELKEIISNQQGKVSHIVTNKNEIIPCEFVGISTGVIANIDFLKDSGIEIAKGILVNEYLETNIKDVYAIGDCIEFKETPPGRKAIEQIWYSGRMQGETLAQIICGNKISYKPGPFFNSAKFFDLEYQTYGVVPSKVNEGDEFYSWQHPTKEILLTFLYQRDNNLFKGINCYGTRLRHETFDKWLKKGVTLNTIIENFSSAVFDKEFEKNYIPLLIANYNNTFSTNIKPRKRSFFNSHV